MLPSHANPTWVSLLEEGANHVSHVIHAWGSYQNILISTGWNRGNVFHEMVGAV